MLHAVDALGLDGSGEHDVSFNHQIQIDLVDLQPHTRIQGYAARQLFRVARPFDGLFDLALRGDTVKAQRTRRLLQQR